MRYKIEFDKKDPEENPYSVSEDPSGSDIVSLRVIAVDISSGDLWVFSAASFQ